MRLLPGAEGGALFPPEAVRVELLPLGAEGVERVLPLPREGVVLPLPREGVVLPLPGEEVGVPLPRAAVRVPLLLPEVSLPAHY